MFQWFLFNIDWKYLVLSWDLCFIASRHFYVLGDMQMMQWNLFPQTSKKMSIIETIGDRRGQESFFLAPRPPHSFQPRFFGLAVPLLLWGGSLSHLPVGGGLGALQQWVSLVLWPHRYQHIILSLKWQVFITDGALSSIEKLRESSFLYANLFKFSSL